MAGVGADRASAASFEEFMAEKRREEAVRILHAALEASCPLPFLPILLPRPRVLAPTLPPPHQLPYLEFLDCDLHLFVFELERQDAHTHTQCVGARDNIYLYIYIHQWRERERERERESLCVCLFVFVCVCVWEREREREREGLYVESSCVTFTTFAEEGGKKEWCFCFWCRF